MIELITKLGLAAGVTVVAYALVQKVLGPLVAYVVDRKRTADVAKPKADRVTALEINLTNLSTQVTQLETRLGVKNTELVNLVDERSIATDNKLDIVLAELKSLREDHEQQHRALSERMADQYRILGERIKGAETNIEHLLSKRTR